MTRFHTQTPYQWMIVLLSLLATAASGASTASAQQVRADAAPGFRIEPLVVKAGARPGQIVPFEFRISGGDKPAHLQVRLVNLVQRPNGQIHISQGDPPQDVRLKSPDSLVVEPGDQAKLQGEIRVPGHSSYLAFGLLVTDRGQPMKAEPSAAQTDGRRRLAVRYVTQYLLRIEIQVHGGRGATTSDMKLPTASLVSRDGLAVVHAEVENPTPTAVQFQARARLLRGEGEAAVPVGPYFMLGHPIRANEEGPRRYEVRALGDTRLHLEAPVPDPVFPGNYQLEVQLINERRMVGARKRFDLSVDEDDFPAQRAVVARVVNAVHMTPSQIELSLDKGGSRMTTVSIENAGSEAVDVTINAKPRRGDGKADWVVVRPADLTLRPGSKRGVMIALDRRNMPSSEADLYAMLQVSVQPVDGGAGGEQLVPIGLLAGKSVQRQATFGDWRWESDKTEIILPVTNPGSRHLALDGRLTMVDEFGRKLKMEAGYGRWLLPGDSETLTFTLPRSLPRGTYQMNWDIGLGPDAAPTQWQQELVVP